MILIVSDVGNCIGSRTEYLELGSTNTNKHEEFYEIIYSFLQDNLKYEKKKNIKD